MVGPLHGLGLIHPRRWGPTPMGWAPSERTFRAINADIGEADYVLVNSDYVKETLVDSGRAHPDRVHVVYLGVDTEQFHPRGEADRADLGAFTILYAGSIERRKGVHYLLEATRRLQLPRARLFLVGDLGRDVDLSQYYGLYHHIPSLPHARLAAVYRDADVFVFPSLAEGSARVVYEAMASGLPVITTRESGSVVRDGVDGWIVPARSVDAIGERIEKIRQTPSLGIEIGKRARARMVAEFTWRDYGERVVNVYRAIAK